MKAFLILFLFITQLFSEAKLEHVTINNHDFTIVTEDYDIYDSKGTVLKFYREERNNDLKHLFSLTLYDKTGSCSAKSIENGHYEINGTTITLYSFWDRRGRIYDVPYGARIMKYDVQPSGTLKLISSEIYIETAEKSFDKESGMRFLWQTPETEKERMAFSRYIQNTERQFKGTFLVGEEAEQLMKKVKSALERKMSKRWK